MKNNVSTKILEGIENATEITSNIQGECPKCGGTSLDYGDVVFEDFIDDGAVYFPWTCPDCGAEGREYYYIYFATHKVKDKEGYFDEVEKW
ncbi:MAG: hypothetical protein J6T15_04980 [Bacilli bacterium]|nr:hypothetical protein [Bacilli bacterium]